MINQEFSGGFDFRYPKMAPQNISYPNFSILRKPLTLLELSPNALCDFFLQKKQIHDKIYMVSYHQRIDPLLEELTAAALGSFCIFFYIFLKKNLT